MVSIYRSKSGPYGVRYREGGKHRSRLVGSRQQAQQADAKIKEMARLGQLGLLTASRTTLAEFVDETVDPRWDRLAPKTQALYRWLWRKHINPHIGGYRLSEITPQLCDAFRSDLERKVGRVTVGKALALLHGILKLAVVTGHLPSNPAESVQKPPQTRSRAIRPVPVGVVEKAREKLLANGRIGDAALISLLAYAGPRPFSEGLRVEWADIRERTIIFDASKTGRSRGTRLEAPLAHDLREWRLATPSSSGLVFPRPDGGPWREHDFNNWRRRTFKPLAAEFGYEDISPYYLRHTIATLWIYAGHPIPDIAGWLGHSPQVLLSTYSHVLADVDPARHVSVEDQIWKARKALKRRAV